MPILPPQPRFHLYTDSSLFGWGAYLEKEAVNAYWEPSKWDWHINALELLAIMRGLRRFAPTLRGQTVMIFTDNMVSLHYIRKQGGTRSKRLLILALQIWNLAIRFKNFIFQFFWNFILNSV